MNLGHIEDDFFNSNRYTKQNSSDRNIGVFDSPENTPLDMNNDNNTQSNFIQIYNSLAQKFYEADTKQQYKNRDVKKKGFVNNLLNIFK